METNEIMTNEEVVETTTEVIETTAEEITKASTGKGFKVAAGIGLSVLAGVLLWKYAVKPIAAKKRAKKEFEVSDTVCDYEPNDQDDAIDSFDEDDLEEEPAEESD